MGPYIAVVLVAYALWGAEVAAGIAVLLVIAWWLNERGSKR